MDTWRKIEFQLKSNLKFKLDLDSSICTLNNSLDTKLKTKWDMWCKIENSIKI